MIHWIGVLVSLFLVALATFWLAQAVLSATFRFPRSFNVGFWALIFPIGVYTNAVCKLGADLQSDGLKVWAAVCAVAVTLLWLGCALATFWKGVWRASLSNPPSVNKSMDNPAGEDEHKEALQVE